MLQTPPPRSFGWGGTRQRLYRVLAEVFDGALEPKIFGEAWQDLRIRYDNGNQARLQTKKKKKALLSFIKIGTESV